MQPDTRRHKSMLTKAKTEQFQAASVRYRNSQGTKELAEDVYTNELRRQYRQGFQQGEGPATRG